jgi:MerR family transcriptional regulator, copper efflux regulator
MLRSMEALTIHEAAETTGWSARMLRYVERAGLITPSRSASGYRLYGPAQLQRLRTLKELLGRFDLGLSDVAFAARMASSAELRDAVSGWLEAEARRPEGIDTAQWLAFEQDKHQKLLAAA